MELNSFVAHLMVNVKTRWLLTKSVVLHLFLTVLNSVHRLRQQNMQFHLRRIEQIELHDKVLSYSHHIDSLRYQVLVDAIDQWTFLSRYDRDHPSQCNRNRTDQHSFLLNER